jgi:SAM-dependent methyltransferase
MLLVEVIKSIFKKPTSDETQLRPGNDSRNSVLNVGGGNKTIQIPQHYQNWQHLLLDIDPEGDADIVMDARKLKNLPKGQFDAIYCSHNLEHYFRHDVASVLSGFLHVLKPDGFAEIHVPNMRSVLKHFVETGMEIDDILYESPSGPISVLDVIYGWGKQIESTGVDFYAHKTGFTHTSLMAALNAAGFVHVWIAESTDDFSIGALAFKEYPSPSQFALLGLSPT